LIDANRPYVEVLEEYKAGGAVNVVYVYGLALVSQNRGGKLSYYHVDGLGSTQALTDASGKVTDRYVYDAFGRAIGQTGSTVNDYLFAGEQRDPSIGLDYLRARYLSVSLGRFYGRSSGRLR
jgi:YD repeat-containing protein